MCMYLHIEISNILSIGNVMGITPEGKHSIIYLLLTFRNWSQNKIEFHSILQRHWFILTNEPLFTKIFSIKS